MTTPTAASARAGAPSGPEIFDVTIRDGSYVIDFQFHPEDVRLLCRALDACGFRYIEVGHGLGLNASVVKEAAAASDEEYLSAAADSCGHARFGAFFIPGIGTRDQLRQARCDFGMHFIRIGSEPEKIDGMLPFVTYAKELGYEVMCNFMKTYGMAAAEVAQRAAVLAAAGADVIYVVDSAGGMLPDEVGTYVRAIAEHCPARLGFHGHNNLELAISNSLSAWRNGATLIDCSVGGLGRSSGNTRTELFIPVLKALGAAVSYDFERTLQVWEQIVQPLLVRRPITPQEIAGGYARVHSGLMGPFVETARRHQVSVVKLLNAYGDALHAGTPVSNLDALAARLGTETSVVGTAGALPLPGSGSLLRLHSANDAHAIRNTFRSFDEVVRAVQVLAHKAALPVVGLVEIAPSADEEPYLVGEYLYHDDHFIVMRAAFGSAAAFIEVTRRHPGWCQLLVFDSRSAAARAELAALEPEWRNGQRVLWADLAVAKYHALFAALYQVAMDRDARHALLLGGNPQLLAHFTPPALSAVELYCAAPDPHALNQIGIARLAREPLAGMGPAPALPAQFDLVVLLSPVSGPELAAVLDRLAPGGLLLDCLGPTAFPALYGPQARHAVVSITLWKAVTGALLTLLETLDCPSAAGCPVGRSESVTTRTRAA